MCEKAEQARGISPRDSQILDYGGRGKTMGEFAIGQSVLRREDPRLLRGHGRFFDDLKLADQLHAAILRSPHAHAEITGIWRAAHSIKMISG